MLKVNEIKGAELYAGYGSANSKQVAINAIATASLDFQALPVIHALLKIIKSHQKTRDKIAHWVWGFTPRFDDAMVLVDPKVLWRRQGTINQAKRTKLRSVENWQKIMRIDYKNVYLYKTSEPINDAKTFQEIGFFINMVSAFILSPVGDPLLRAARYSKLIRDARMKEALNQL